MPYVLGVYVHVSMSIRHMYMCVSVCIFWRVYIDAYVFMSIRMYMVGYVHVYMCAHVCPTVCIYVGVIQVCVCVQVCGNRRSSQTTIFM